MFRLFLVIFLVIIPSESLFSQRLSTADGSRNRTLPRATIKLVGNEIRYTGHISPESVAEFGKMLSTSAARGVSRLRIDSVGGDAEAGLRMGALVHDRRFDVIVDRVCGSACALYVAPAGRRTTFSSDALLIFHQMPSPQMRALGIDVYKRTPGIDDAERARRTARFLATMDRVLAEQDGFYRKLGVDPARVNKIMEIMFDLGRGLRSAGKVSDIRNITLVLSGDYLKTCIGFERVEAANYTLEQSRHLARAKASPIAFIVGENLYFDGVQVSPKRYSCA